MFKKYCGIIFYYPRPLGIVLEHRFLRRGRWPRLGTDVLRAFPIDLV